MASFAPDHQRPLPTGPLSELIGSVYNSSTISFYINGSSVILSNPDPTWTIIDLLRIRHGLKGTKLGCGEGGCGACTVVLQMIDYRTKRLRHLAVNACLFPIVGLDGKHVITVEGLGSVTNPHPLQERLAKLHGSQCGFCTPGILMSLYALIRNSYDSKTKEFKISAKQIELDGHLDGNLCRCTGYKPILEAAKTFITEDLGHQLSDETWNTFEDAVPQSSGSSPSNLLNNSCNTPSSGCCGRPGKCCKDTPSEGSNRSSSHFGSEVSSFISTPLSDHDMGGSSHDTMKDKRHIHESETLLLQMKLRAITMKGNRILQPHSFLPYLPETEIIFPPLLWKHERRAVCFGDAGRIWFRPVTIQQVIELKAAYPAATLVCGASEVQREARSNPQSFSVMIYIADVEDLCVTEVPTTAADLDNMHNLVIAANTPLVDVENICKKLHTALGPRAMVLGALYRQLRFFAGRQIRNVASIAGNIATASPISDLNPILVAAGASIIVQSKSEGQLSFLLSQFFSAYRCTKLPHDGVITQIQIPMLPPNIKQVIKAYKQGKRKSDDIAIVTAAFNLRISTSNCVEDLTVVFGGMGPVTLEFKATADAVNGKTWFDSETLTAGLDALARNFELNFSAPGGMVHYRKTLALSFFFRFWHESSSELGLGKVDSSIVEEIQREISSGTRDDGISNAGPVVGQKIPHLSALKQCTGEAVYLDDMPRQDRELFGGLVLSTKAHATITSVNWSPALEMDGVIGYIDKDSIPKEFNVWGSISKDEPFFAEDKVYTHGQVIGMVYAETAHQARAGAQAVEVVYQEHTPILTIDEAIKVNSFIKHGRELRKGEAISSGMDQIFNSCDRVFQGRSKIGGQEHFYLETNTALVIPQNEDGALEVWSSTQNTMETQEYVSQVTGVPSNRINVRVRRLGGAFGGKESRSVPIACILAIAAKKERRPMRIMLTRDEDMMISGQRHPIQARWKVGTTKDGKLVALDADLYSNAGWTLDMSGAVMDRCCTHLDNCYNIPHAWIRGHLCKTNTHSNTAFRGFGGPQAMFITEQIISAIADGLNMDVDEIRQKNLYQPGDRTPFLQQINEDWHIPTMLSQIRTKSDYVQRKKDVIQFNASNKWKKRGIALLPTKFGLSFATALHLNQASASVKIYADGSILLHHGGTEMGQGLYTKMCQIAAQELKVPLESVYTQDSQTYQTANASPTAASASSDLNGMAIKNACDQLNPRLQPYREVLGENATMRQIAQAAYRDRVNLSAQGFWKMPRIGYKWGTYDEETVKPMYFYFTQGVAVSEVELDLLTGDHTVLRTDIMMDVGQSINPALDCGQIEGAFVQGLGLFTMEETLWSPNGALLTRGPSTYKIPTFSDIPQVFNIALLKQDEHGNPISWKRLGSINSSKGIGEPPLFLGASVFFALRMAVSDARKMNGLSWEEDLFQSPATVETLRVAIGDRLVEMAKVEPKEGEMEAIVRAT